MVDIYINGEITPIDQALLSIQDAGLQHAVGLFETMYAQNNRVFRLHAHLQRLATSARELGMSRELDVEALAHAVHETLKHNQLACARIRLTVTPGSLSLLHPSEEPPKMTTLVVATPPIQYDPAYFEKGIRVIIAPPMANPFDAMQGHKTLAYWGRLRTLRQAAAVGAGEAIWLNITNHLASGAVSNLFLVKDGTLLTPYARGEEAQGALPAPVLPGITRQTIIELAQKRDIPVVKKMLAVKDMLEADEVFLTNSGWQLLPVSTVERKTIGQGKVGKLSQQLREDLLGLIEQQCAGDTA